MFFLGYADTLSMSDTFQIPNFKIIKPIGSGGMGDVYLAEDNRLKRKVAIKVLKTNSEENIDADAIKRFITEARSIAQVNHPNIITVFDIIEQSEENPHPMIVMEYLRGKNLKEYCLEHETTPEFFLKILKELADAFALVHKNKIIHRDIKPSNIFICEHGQAKILDFGIAKWNDDPDSAETTVNQFVGTVYYTPPEVFAFGKQQENTDIYSLGLSIISSILQDVPFKGETISEVVENIKFQDVRIPPLLEGKLPEPLTELLYEMIEKDPHDRPNNMEEVSSRCHKILNKTSPQNLQVSLGNLSQVGTIDISLSDISVTQTAKTKVLPKVTKITQKKTLVANKRVAPLKNNLKREKKSHLGTTIVAASIILAIAMGGLYYKKELLHFINSPQDNATVQNQGLLKDDMRVPALPLAEDHAPEVNIHNEHIKSAISYLGQTNKDRQLRVQLIRIDQTIYENRQYPMVQKLANDKLPNIESQIRLGKSIVAKINIGLTESLLQKVISEAKYPTQKRRLIKRRLPGSNQGASDEQ